MATAIDIHDHKADPMISDWTERREAGTPNPLDLANAAVERASQAASIFSESDDCDRANIESRFERVRLAARACGLAVRRGEERLAASFAATANSEAVVLDSYDSARLDGLQRAVPLGDLRQVKLK